MQYVRKNPIHEEDNIQVHRIIDRLTIQHVWVSKAFFIDEMTGLLLDCANLNA